MPRISINTDEISDWKSFHKLFARELGFPSVYGKNMNAWIDCMTSLNSPEHGMTSVHVKPGEVLVLDLGELGDFPERCPEIYEAIIDCTAFVNYAKLDVGEEVVLTLAFSK